MLCSNKHHAIFFDGPDLLLSVATSDCSGSFWGHSRTIRPMRMDSVGRGAPLYSCCCCGGAGGRTPVANQVPRNSFAAVAVRAVKLVQSEAYYLRSRVQVRFLPAALAERP